MSLAQLYYIGSSGAPTQRNWNPISTSNASWGWGPNTEKLDPNFYRQCRLGWPQHKEILFL
ncbi:hypothetical protein CKX96_00905 [Staphylococcus argenteus]|nr:hypothetical protein CJ017_13245 [Staphylococcus argenteus]ATZ88329.1 hypothetical protein CKO49_13230 [Staphylococcus argenteus]KAA0799052.1 hypothetical protein DVU64_10885 [Staphylococcus argenteus]MZG26545.1 hypothetical protein [Staphylococcus argenteus]PNY92190.1 hypothetical protein CD033_08755 [Staphylococcus argenteus]